MRILITEGAGFIGRHIAEHFRDRAEVRVLDNRRCGFKANLSGLDCQLIVGSILDRDFVREAMKGGDSVFHLAAMGSVQESGQKPNECAEIQCLGYSDCLEEAARADSRRPFVRARDTSAVCRTIAKRDRLVGWHRLQSVRERLQQPPIGLPQQSLHASNHS